MQMIGGVVPLVVATRSQFAKLGSHLAAFIRGAAAAGFAATGTVP